MDNQDLKERIAEFEKEYKALQAKYQIKPGISLEFPQFKILPEEVQLALLIVQKYDYKFMLSYEDLKGK